MFDSKLESLRILKLLKALGDRGMIQMTIL